MALFQKGDPAKKKQFVLEEKLKAALADRDKVADRLRAFEARVTERRDAARALVRDGGDDAKLTAIESEMRAAEDRVVSLAAGLADLDKDISELEREIAEIVDARCRAETAAAINELVAAWETAATAFEAAARQLETVARETAPILLDGHGVAAFAMNAGKELPPAAQSIVTQLKHHAKQVLAGHAPASLPKPEPEPIAVIEAAAPTQTVFLLKSVKFRDHGKVRHALQFEDCEMPVQTAQRALRCSAAVLLSDPRRRELHGARGGHHVNQSAIDIVDLDSEEASRPAHIDPIMASDPVLAAANFREVDRSAETRVIKIAVARL